VQGVHKTLTIFLIESLDPDHASHIWIMVDLMLNSSYKIENIRVQRRVIHIVLIPIGIDKEHSRQILFIYFLHICLSIFVLGTQRSLDLKVSVENVDDIEEPFLEGRAYLHIKHCVSGQESEYL
jgi:hypothetical protein